MELSEWEPISDLYSISKDLGGLLHFLGMKLPYKLGGDGTLFSLEV